MNDIGALFAAQGPFAQHVPGYSPRLEQVELAQAISHAITHRRIFLAEAGTGTGKTYAYLVPALLSGGKVIISTGTKTLQDQLFSRDLPLVRDTLKIPATIALLKGRANYLCHYYLERHSTQGSFASRDDVIMMQHITRWARTTQHGDRSELAEVPEQAPIWSLVTSTRDNCLGQQCSYHEKCCVLAARREAMNADIVVVNHHLFFADIMLREEGVSELLPHANTVIFDEAHQLPDIATVFFGERVSSAHILELTRDANLEIMRAARDTEGLLGYCQALNTAGLKLRAAIPHELGRLNFEQVMEQPDFSDALLEINRSLQIFIDALSQVVERDDALNKCHQRGVELKIQLDTWLNTADHDDWVRWVDVSAHIIALHATPLDIADIFRQQLEGSGRSWIFTSATLAVRGNFEHYANDMGLQQTLEDEQGTGYWESPFNYAEQALLYVPQGMPNPNERHYTDAVVDKAIPILAASRGRAFILCTSLRAMEYTAQRIRKTAQEQGWTYPILVQGERSRSELLLQFRELGNAILIGSQSFWEGVDVRGDALSLVIIDRLPFAPPDDPVLSARITRLTRMGHNAFMEYQLPRATIALKQGAGRLIRDPLDRGVLMICDPRLVNKPYGKQIWRSLPPMRRTREETEAVDFFTTTS